MPGDGQVCKLDISKFDVCTNAHAYGYNNSSPCIFLKLNRIYGWQPEYYNDPEDLPLDMPDELQADIRNLPPAHRNQIWVTCRGENGADREIIGDIEYYPTRGFPSYFYPYTNTKGYLSPLVAVKFTRPLRKFPRQKGSWRYLGNILINIPLARPTFPSFLISHFPFLFCSYQQIKS